VLEDSKDTSPGRICVQASNLRLPCRKGSPGITSREKSVHTVCFQRSGVQDNIYFCVAATPASNHNLEMIARSKLGEKKLVTQHSNQIYTTKSKAEGGGKQYTMQKNSLYNVDLARYQKTCEKNTGQNCHQQWHSMYRLHSASKALQKPWEVKTPHFSLSLKCWICHKIHQ